MTGIVNRETDRVIQQIASVQIGGPISGIWPFFTSLVVIPDLGNRRERNFDNLPVRALHFNTWSCKGLCSFHAVYRASHTAAINGQDLDV